MDHDRDTYYREAIGNSNDTYLKLRLNGLGYNSRGIFGSLYQPLIGVIYRET